MHRRRSQFDFLNNTRHAVYRDKVAHIKLPFANQKHAGQDIAYQVLRRKADHKPANSGCCEQGGYCVPQIPKPLIPRPEQISTPYIEARKKNCVVKCLCLISVEYFGRSPRKSPEYRFNDF